MVILLQEIIDLWLQRSDFYFELLLQHIQISLTAIMIAGCIGLVVGILINEYQKTSKFALSVINFIYTIPSISLLGFLIPLSGIGDTTAIIALTIYALLPMVRNTYTGLHNVSELIVEAAKGMGSTKFQILCKIKLPLALPVIMSGIRNMAVMTIALAGIASFIGAGGLGIAIYRGISTNNKAMTIVGSLMIALLALFVDLLLGMIEKRMQHTHRSRHNKKKKSVLFGILCLCVALLLYSFMGNGKSDTIHIATKPMSEQYIIGEMLRTILERDTDLNVEITQGVGGGTNNIQPALQNGDFDLYPEYTGTGWNQVLKKDSFYSELIFDELQAMYHEMGLRWQTMLGFNNTFGLAVRKDIAETYHLKNYSDLQAVADQLVFGAQYDFFEREDGFQALCDTYQLNFKNTIDLDNGLKYDAMNDKKLDVMIVYTTDGQLSVSDVVVLRDDKNLFASYVCGFVVREDTLEKYPELGPLLDILSNTITDEEMAEMNYRVEALKEEPADVANAFLKEKGL